MKTNKILLTNFIVLILLVAATIFPISDNNNAIAEGSSESTELSLSTYDIGLILEQNGKTAFSDPSVISVSTNNYTGYTLIAESYYQSLWDVDYGETEIPTVDHVTTELPVNTWGISFDGVNIFPAPSEYGDVIASTDSANTSVDEYNFRVAANVDETIEPGCYATHIDISAIVNPAIYNIEYLSNVTEGSVYDMPLTQYDNDFTGEGVYLSNHVPKRNNYVFVGWSTDRNATTAEFNPGDYLSINRITSNDISLYAIWASNICPGMLKMQDIAFLKDSFNLEQQVQMCDARDNKVYWVAKLKDGNIWMTQNLDYELTGDNNRLYPETSNVTTYRYINLSNNITYGDGGDYYLDNGVTKTSGYSLLDADSETRHYHIGNYYNWTAATAGVGIHDGTARRINESICPAGWQLPVGGSYTDAYSFSLLTRAYNITKDEERGTSDDKILSAPLYFTRTGWQSNGSEIVQIENIGEYLSGNSHNSSPYVWMFDFRPTLVSVYVTTSSSSRLSVRCVAI